MMYSQVNKATGDERLLGPEETRAAIWLFLSFNPMRDRKREEITEAEAIKYYNDKSYYFLDEVTGDVAA